MMSPGMFDAAPAVRPFLRDLLGDSADDFELQLVALLQEPRSDTIAQRLAALISSTAETQDWAAAFFERKGVPPGISVELEHLVERGPGDASFEPLAGDGSVVPPERYECAIDGNYVWFRIDVDDPVPTCPDQGHDSTRLVRRDG